MDRDLAAVPVLLVHGAGLLRGIGGVRLGIIAQKHRVSGCQLAHSYGGIPYVENNLPGEAAMATT
jgi:hypothetical protein